MGQFMLLSDWRVSTIQPGAGRKAAAGKLTKCWVHCSLPHCWLQVLQVISLLDHTNEVSGNCSPPTLTL